MAGINGTANSGTGDTSVGSNGGAYVNSGESRNLGGIAVEPITDTDSSNSPGPRKGGWPKGKPRGSSSGGRSAASGSGTGRDSAPAKNKAKNPLSLKKLLATIHMVAAKVTGFQGWELDDDECTELAEAIQELQTYYPKVDVPGVVLAWVNLGIAAGKIYGTRISAAAITPAKKKQPAPITVQWPASAQQ